VFNLSIRNTIDTFFQHVCDYDIVLISSKNGHAELYLNDFPRLLAQYRLTDDSAKLWYLGGSLSVSESSHQVKKRYLSMGFTNVYPKPISFREVLNDVNADIHRYEIRKRPYRHGKVKARATLAPINCDTVVDRKWTERELSEQRKKVLEEWPTGERILSTPTAIRKTKSLDEMLWRNQEHFSGPLLQPRTGVADINEQIELLHFLEMSGSDISSVQLDSASRSKFYEKASKGRDESISRKRSVLNGFPVPVYGADELKRLINSLKTPFQLRGGGPDHRFTYEIAINAGSTGVEGGFLCYLLPYDRLCSPLESLSNWQYIDRLCALQEEKFGTVINREYFGVLTASLLEPSLAIVINIIQSILSLQQGCRSITVGYAEQGNRCQDIAAVQVMREMVEYYLRKFRYNSFRLTTVFHQYMAAFPSSYEKASQLIQNSAVTAMLAGATKIMVKTPVESIEIPDRNQNAVALNLCRMALLNAVDVKVNDERLKLEKDILRKEVKQIMEAIIDLGNYSVAIGAIKAVECGLIDIPWSPNIYNKGDVMGIRDKNGAIRFINTGNLPFSNEVKDFHLQKVTERKDLEREADIFSLLEKDLSRIWKNDYASWPLDGNYII